MAISSRSAQRARSLLFGATLLSASAAIPVLHAQTPDASPPPAAPPTSNAPVFLNHPTLADTAQLKSGDSVVSLFGIKGWGGDPVRALGAFIASNGDRVTCQPHEGGTYTCMLPTGIDLAEAALANGAAETLADAPPAYVQQEKAAQAEHAGIWAALPPVPVDVEQPVVQTTAQIAGSGAQVLSLDGLVGFAAQFYTLQLQNYIAAHGNRLHCQQQSNSRYVCLLPDGTDIGALALSNGLARVDVDATASYRADQAKAVASKAGFWFDPPVEGGGLTTIPVLTAVPNCCTVQPAEMAEGISYADGVPVAVIDNEPVFLGYAGLLGFGFFDINRVWHAAPERYGARLAAAGFKGNGLPRPATPTRPVAEFHPPLLPGTTPTVAPRVVAPPLPALGSATTPFRAPVVVAQPFGVARAQPEFTRPLGVGLRPGLIGSHPGLVAIRPLPPLQAAPHFGR